MKKDNYTERKNWEDYWSSYTPEKIQRKNQFQGLFASLPNGDNEKTFLEIGGFPGTFSVYFKKFLGYKVSLLDYFIDYETINNLLSINGLSDEDMQIIETDLFQFQSLEKYNLVFSSGFIEHFEDTREVIRLHLEHLNSEGILLITLPNLRGINGWIQRKFHYENYAIHNITCMDVNRLKGICQKFDFKVLEVDYYGKPMIWLENRAPVTRITKKLVKLFSLFLKLFPFKGRWLSPFIVIKAIKG